MSYNFTIIELCTEIKKVYLFKKKKRINKKFDETLIFFFGVFSLSPIFFSYQNL